MLTMRFLYKKVENPMVNHQIPIGKIENPRVNHQVPL